MRHTTVTRKLLPYPVTRPNFHVRVAINDAIKYRTAAPPVIAVRGWCDGDFHVFSVRNNGIGIAPEYGQAIFQLFKRLHVWVQVPGRGIGLAVCKRIVEYHGGRHPGGISTRPGRDVLFHPAVRQEVSQVADNGALKQTSPSTGMQTVRN